MLTIQLMLTVCCLAQATQPSGLGDSPGQSPDRPLIVASIRRSLQERVWAFTGGRTREPTHTERQERNAEQGDAVMSGLHEIGVNLLVIPYGGSGPDSSERDDRAFAVQLARRARIGGFGIALWLPIDQIVPSHWPASASVEDWLMRDEHGALISGDLPSGKLVSWLSPPARTHIHNLLKSAQDEIAPDLYLAPRLHAVCGHEQAARNAFAAAMKSSATPGSITDPPANNDTVSPAARAWQRFRTDCISSEIRALRDGQKGTPVRIGVEASVSVSDQSANSGAAVDILAMAEICDVIWWRSLLNVDSNGRVRTSIPTFRLFQNTKARIILESDAALAVAESLVFGRNTTGCIAHFNNGLISADSNSRKPLETATVAMARFLGEHQPFYSGIERVADFVLYMPTDNGDARTPSEQTLFAQTEGSLISHRLLYSVALTNQFLAVTPAQTLIVLGNRPLTGALADSIRRHLSQGGGVACVGRSDVERDLRAVCDQAAPASLPVTLDAPQRWRAGKGRVLGLARFGPVTHTWMVARREGTRGPSRVEDDAFRASLEWVRGGPPSVHVSVDGAYYVELTRGQDHRHTLVHVLNYDPRRPVAAQKTSVRISREARATRVRRYMPASEAGLLHAATAPTTAPVASSAPANDNAGEAIDFTQEGDRVIFQSAPCTVYDLYVIEQ